MKERMKIVGSRYFDETPVTVTDPCYDRSVFWCNVDRIRIVPGLYRLAAYRIKKWYKEDRVHHYYEITSCAAIYHEDYMASIGNLRREYIGDAGVDAGLCGFYQNKPDYSDDEWYEFCNKIKNMDYLITEEGFCTSSGYGDGGYNVFAVKNEDGDTVGLEIRYISGEDD